MSQRTEKIRRQVDQLRADVDALQAVWLAQEHHAAAELEASAERARQAHRRAREAKAIAQTWRRNAILALILAGLTGCVALAISVKAAEEPTTPMADEPAVFDTGRLPGDDTPAQEPEEPENELIEAALLASAHRLDNVTVTHYCICQQCCGKAPDHPAYGITASGRRATPYVSMAVDPSVIPLGADVLVDMVTARSITIAPTIPAPVLPTATSICAPAATPKPCSSAAVPPPSTGWILRGVK